MAEIQSLHPEIWSDILAILAREHMPSVHSFSLANKTCYELANTYCFPYIHFNVGWHDNWMVELQHWECILQQRKAFGFVRRLSFGGYPWRSGGFLGSGYRGSFQPEDDEWTKMHHRWAMVDSDPADQRETDAWEPMARFISRLTGLQTLFWVHCDHFPSRLLDTLHKDHPQCRLHLRQLALGGLGRSPDPESYAYKLATSPSLASVTCRFSFNNEASVYNEHAATQMIAGFAPNLTHAHLYHDFFPEPEDVVVQLARRSLQPWKPSADRGIVSSKVRALTLTDPDPKFLHTLNMAVPFQDITTLRVGMFSRFDALKRVAEYHFNSLQCLALHLHLHPELPHSGEEGTVEDRDASLLLSKLRPLKSLLVTASEPGNLEESTEAALKHHGPSLRRFGLKHRWVDPIRLGTISKIRLHCPNVRELTLRVSRSTGDANEVMIYREIGKLTQLNHINLELDCAALNMRSEPSYVQYLLINLAIDEALVRAIFALLIESPGSLLESTTITTDLSVYPFIHNMESFKNLMQDTLWQVFRAQESYKDKRFDPVYLCQTDERYERKIPCNEDFYKLWSQKGKGWVLDWHSFPLQLQ